MADPMRFTGEPAFPGCYVTARPAAVFWLTGERGRTPRILTVPAGDPRFGAVRDLADVPGHLTIEIAHFSGVCKELEPGKSTGVRGWQDRAQAEQLIDAARTRASGFGPVQSSRDRSSGPARGDARR